MRDNIETGLVRFCADIMSNRLSHDSNGRTNVIKSYGDKGLKPDLPFMTIGVVSADTPYGWLLDQYVNEHNQTCYVVAFKVPVMVTAYGKGSHSIVTEFKQRLESASNRDKIESLTGARLLDSGDLPNNYDYLTTDFENSTPLIINLVYNSTLIDPESSYIERVIAEGVAE